LVNEIRAHLIEVHIGNSDNETFSNYLTQCIVTALRCYPEQAKNILKAADLSVFPCGELGSGHRCPLSQECRTI
jgi:hypothetical protein